MVAINEDLIQKVFAEMVGYRSSLAKYLPDKDEEEDVDLRIIADLVIKNFPWPVGVELRRLFSGSMRQSRTVETRSDIQDNRKDNPVCELYNGLPGMERYN